MREGRRQANQPGFEWADFDFGTDFGIKHTIVVNVGIIRSVRPLYHRTRNRVGVDLSEQLIPFVVLARFVIYILGIQFCCGVVLKGNRPIEAIAGKVILVIHAVSLCRSCLIRAGLSVLLDNAVEDIVAVFLCPLLSNLINNLLSHAISIYIIIITENLTI